MRAIKFAALFVPFCAAAHCAAAAPQKLDLGGCINYAMGHSAEIREARTLVDKAAGQKAEAAAGRLPMMEAISLLGPVPKAHGNAVYSPDSDTLGNFSLSNLTYFTRTEFTLTWPLYSFGRISAYNRAASGGIRVAQAQLAQKKQEVSAEIKKYYYGYLFAREMKMLVGEMRDELEKAINKTEEQIRAKSKKTSKRDVLRLKVFLVELKKGELEAKKGMKLARGALAQKIGMEDEEDLEIADDKLKPVKFTLEPLETYRQRLFSRRPEWMQLKEGQAARKALSGATGRESLPVIFMLGTVRHAFSPGREDQKNPFVSDDFNYFYGGAIVGARWNMNFFTNSAKQKQTHADYMGLMEKEQFARQGLFMELKKAYADVEEAQELISITKDGLKAARGWALSSGLGYAVGVGKTEEMLTSLGALGKSRKDYFDSVHKFNVAVTELSRVAGMDPDR